MQVGLLRQGLSYGFARTRTGIRFLVIKRYDAFRDELNLMAHMPDRLSDPLFRFLRQNRGRLSRDPEDV